MAESINLGGSVDTQLVQGAREISKQKYHDPGVEVDRTSAIVGSSAGAVTDAAVGIFKKKESLEAEHEKRISEFQDLAAECHDKLANQNEPLPQKVVDAVQDEITRLQNDFEKVNIVGKGDTVEMERARTKIMAELTRVTNQAIATRADFMKIGQSAGNWNPNLIHPDNIDPLKSILNIGDMDNNPNLSVGYIDGKLTFTTKNYSTGQVKGHIEEATDVYDPEAEVTPSKDGVIEEYQYGDPVSFTSNQMAKAIPTKNLSNDSMILDGQMNFVKQGQNDGKHGNSNYFRKDDGSIDQYAFDETKTALAGEIVDKKQFRDIANRRMAKMGMPSFRMGLIKNMNIPIQVLDNMFMGEGGEKIAFADVFASMDSTGPDGKPDGFITKEDLVNYEGGQTAFEENIDEIINALTNIEHPAFHFETSRDLLADYYTNFKMQAYEHKYYASGGTKPWEEESEESEETDIMTIVNESKKTEETPE